LRRLDVWLPVSDAFSLVGGILFFCGIVCGLIRLCNEHPYLITASAGIICLMISAIASHRGLIRFLPLCLQEKLLRKTPFDLLMRESGVTNIVRRWARVFLLTQEDNEEEIRSIVKGLHPDFLDQVFRQSSMQMLPLPLRQLLLPVDAVGDDAVLLQKASSWTSSRRGPARFAGVGSLMARCVGVVPQRRPTGADTDILSPAGIRELLMEKKEAKKRVAKEPPLTPLLRSWAFRVVSFNTLRDSILSSILEQGQQLITLGAAAATVLWTGAGWVLNSPRAHRALTNLASSSSSSSSPLTEIAASRLVCGATALCVLGAASSSALTVYMRRHWAYAAPPLQQPKDAIRAAVTDALGPEAVSSHSVLVLPEPEMEESPENSSSEVNGAPARLQKSFSL